MPKVPRQRSREEASVPRLVIREPDLLGRSLGSLELLIQAYPRAASAIVDLLVREGRAYAETPRGRRLERQLSRSRWVERGRLLWEACGLDQLVADGSASTNGSRRLPSEWLRSLARSLAETDVERTLASMMLRVESEVDDQAARSDPRVRTSQ